MHVAREQSRVVAAPSGRRSQGRTPGTPPGLRAWRSSAPCSAMQAHEGRQQRGYLLDGHRAMLLGSFYSSKQLCGWCNCKHVRGGLSGKKATQAAATHAKESVGAGSQTSMKSATSAMMMLAPTKSSSF